MDALVMRIMYAEWMNPRETAGSVMYRKNAPQPSVNGFLYPVAGIRRKDTASSSTRIVSRSRSRLPQA